MESMRNSQIVGVFDALSRLVEIDKVFLANKLKEYDKKSDEEVASDLLSIVYKYFKGNNDLIEYFTGLINNINPTILYNKISRKIKDNRNMSLSDNHRLIIDSFRYLPFLFELEKVDYCFNGSLACFIQKDIPLFRYHKKINILINEDDLEKVKKIMETCGYTFTDLRFPSIYEFKSSDKNNKKDYIYAQIPKSDVCFIFNLFKREKDNSMTVFDYYQRESDNEVIVDRIERKYSMMGTNLRYNNEYEHDGLKIHMCSPEEVYNSIYQSHDINDIKDLEKLEGIIDRNKLKELRQNTNTKTIVKNVLNNSMKKM